MNRALALLLVGSWAGPALADGPPEPAQADVHAPTLARLSVTTAERHRARTSELEHRSAGLLLALPSVERAEVRLALPDEAELQLDRPLPDASAAVVLVTHGAAPDHATIARILRALVPSLAPNHVALVTHASTSARTVAPVLTKVGPFEVQSSSAPWLRIALGGSLALNALLASQVLRVLAKSRVEARPRASEQRNDRPSERKVDRRGRSGLPP